MKKVVKFGGTSLANATQIKKVANILNADKDRNIIIVSAPGKRDSGDTKITDLLISLYEKINNEKEVNSIFSTIKDRYVKIIEELNIDNSFKSEFIEELDKILEISKTKQTKDFLASRGEYLNAKIIAKFLDAHFLDAQNLIIFKSNKKLNYELTYENLKREIENLIKVDSSKKIVIPGFYGSFENGEIVTFSRGGSDITGSLVARAISASLYENWTDVSGVLFTDPRIVKNPSPIEYITYTELRELSYMGASVLHEDAIHPVSKIGIPINILNTNSPSDKGTMIVGKIPPNVKRKVVTGVAGKNGFYSILLEKELMNEEVGFLANVLNIFKDENISVEHIPTGIDTLSVVVRKENVVNKEKLLDKIKNTLSLDNIKLEEEIALIAVVGEGIANEKYITRDIFDALYEEDIRVRMIDQDASGINIIIGIYEKDYERAIKKLYENLNR